MKLNKIKYYVNDRIKYNVRVLGELSGVNESIIQAIQVFINKYGQKNRYILSDGTVVEERDVLRRMKQKAS